MQRVGIAAFVLLIAGEALAQLAGGPGVRLVPRPNPPALLAQVAPNAATVSTSEETLYSYQIEANKLSQDGASRVRVRWQVNTANNDHLKQAQLRVGGLTGPAVCSTSTTTPGLTSGLLIECMRATSSTLDCWCFGEFAPGNVGIVANQITGVDFTQAITLTVTGSTPSAAGDLTLSIVRVDGP